MAVSVVGLVNHGVATGIEWDVDACVCREVCGCGWRIRRFASRLTGWLGCWVDRVLHVPVEVAF